MKTKTLLIGALLSSALITPAWASGNDHFNAGIDAERPGSSSFGSGVNTSSTASDVDHEGGRLTDADRAMVAALVGSSWGRLVSIAGNQAKFAQEMHNGGTQYKTVNLPTPVAKPRPQPPRPVAHRAVPVSRPAPRPAAPAQVDMGPINAPPLEGPAWSPVPEQARTITAVNLPSARLASPVRSAHRRTGFGDLEQTIRARIPVDRRLRDAKLARKGEAEVAAAVNGAAGFGVGAIFGSLPGGGKVFAPKTPAGIVENGLLGAALAEAKRRMKGGRTPYDEQVREVLNMGDRKIEALARSMERHMTPKQVEKFTAAFKKERRAYEKHEREAGQRDRNQREHGR